MLKTVFISLWVFIQIMHVSFMGVECIPGKGIIKILVKMEYNDFVFDYRVAINDDQIFDLSGKIDTTEILVRKYLADKVQIFADNKMLRGQITGIESADGELNIHLLYNYNKRAKLFKVKNTILSGLKENQSTFLIFKYYDFEDDVKLTPEKTEHTFIVK